MSSWGTVKLCVKHVELWPPDTALRKSLMVVSKKEKAVCVLCG